jgi:hypothetical protein
MKQRGNLHGDALDFENPAGAARLAGIAIELEAAPESE